MKCPKTEHISAYLDGELEKKDRASLQSHIQNCARCAQMFQEMRSLRAAFAQAERHPAPYGFATRVIARTTDLEKKKAPWFVPIFVRFAEAAFLLVVITVGILAGKVMTNSSSAVNTTNNASSLSLDVFDATPPGSLGGAYLALTEVGNEK